MTHILIEQFKELEQKHRLVEDNLVDAIWVVDLESLRYEYITPSIEKISGYTPEELLNTSARENLTPKSLRKVQEMIAKELEAFNKGEKVVRTTELELIHKGGYRYWVEIRAKIIKEKEKSLKVIGISREITEQKLAEQKQDKLIMKLNKALAEKEKLLQEVNTLRGLLPICSGCKRIRDEEGKWWPLDMYVTKKTDSKITHTICTDCVDVFYGDRK